MKNLKEITTRLEIAKKKIKKEVMENKGTNVASLGNALKIGTELVAAVAVGTILGFILDNWLDTRPWLTISFFFMGVAAGILNVIKSAKHMHKSLKKSLRVKNGNKSNASI